MPKLMPLKFDSLLERPDLDFLSSSPGLPWIKYLDDHGKKKFPNKRSIVDDAQSLASIRRTLAKIEKGDRVSLPPCMALTRTHLIKVGDPPKSRGVWCYPATLIFFEQLFAIPLIEHFKRNKTAYGLWIEIANGSLSDVINLGTSKSCRWYVGLDFKSFDQTVPVDLIHWAFDIIEECFHLNTANRRLIALIRDYFINTHITLCNGELWVKSSGIPSGSSFTNIIGSIINLLIISKVSISVRGETPDLLFAYGDDSYIGFSSGNVDLFHDEMSRYSTLLGMQINRSKTEISDFPTIKFLGYRAQGRTPWRPVQELWASLIHPEYPDRLFSDVQSRALGLMYASFAVHPEFWEYCQGIISCEPFVLRFQRQDLRYMRLLGINVSKPTVPEAYAIYSRASGG